MSAPKEDYSELAWGLIYGKLSDGERQLALRLTATDPEFLEVLRLELALQKELARLKAAMPEAVKQRVYSSLRGSGSRVLVQEVLRTVLEEALPQMLWPVMKILERSVLASEQL